MTDPIKPPRGFSTNLPFNHTFPYDPLLRERVPMLIALRLALSHFHASVSTDASQPFRAVECGVYSGNGIVGLGRVMRDFGVPFTLTGLDTFEGLPPISEVDASLAPANARYRTVRLFTETSEDKVRRMIEEAGLSEEATLIKGLFSDTLPRLSSDAKYHFINVDCDLYEPHLECLRYFYPRTVPGGVIYFDDYHSVEFPMARRAVDEFLADKPEQILHLRYGEDGPNHTKCFIVKF
jgi:hypothetical protein